MALISNKTIISKTAVILAPLAAASMVLEPNERWPDANIMNNIGAEKRVFVLEAKAAFGAATAASGNASFPSATALAEVMTIF